MTGAALTLADASASIRRALVDVTRGLVEREPLVETIALAAVAREHVLVIGPPGTAKSEAVRRFARAVGGRTFEYLLGRFTEPGEIFGPVDLRKLREGRVETEVVGMLPEAEVAFLDEVFQGSTAILNTLLGILQERVFRRGHTRLDCPLRVCVGASNALPHDESLAAFADRFLVRVFVEPIADPRLEDLLEGGWTLAQNEAVVASTIEAIDVLARAALAADLEEVRPRIAHALRLLRRSGVAMSDRRAVKTQRLVAAAAALTGREQPTSADLWPIVLAVPAREQQAVAREALRDFLAESENATLVAAAEEASLGPLARATRIAAAGRAALDARPDGADAEEYEQWRLRLEGIAREIDAGFLADQTPAELVDLRARIVAELKPAGP
jgi:MoxR-like ATPase